MLEVALPHLGDGNTARVVVEGARLLLRWPGGAEQQWLAGRATWGDDVTGPLVTDVVRLDNDPVIDLRQTVQFVEDRRLSDLFSEADGLAAAALLRGSALRAAVERLATGVRHAHWDASPSDVALISAAAKLRVELELAVRRMPRGALRAELREVDRELESAGIVAAACVIEPTEVESLAEATGTALGGWWLAPVELVDSGRALATKLVPSWWQRLAAPLRDRLAKLFDEVAGMAIPTVATAAMADFVSGPNTLFGFQPISASWIPGLGVLAKGLMPARNPAETGHMAWHLIPIPDVAHLDIDGSSFERPAWQGGSISWPAGGAERIVVALDGGKAFGVALPSSPNPTELSDQLCGFIRLRAQLEHALCRQFLDQVELDGPCRATLSTVLKPGD